MKIFSNFEEIPDDIAIYFAKFLDFIIKKQIENMIPLLNENNRSRFIPRDILLSIRSNELFNIFLEKCNENVNESANSNNENALKINKDLFSIYIYRIIKYLNEEIGISKKTMEIFNSLINDIIFRITKKSIYFLNNKNNTQLTKIEIIESLKYYFNEDLINNFNNFFFFFQIL